MLAPTEATIRPRELSRIRLLDRGGKLVFLLLGFALGLLAAARLQDLDRASVARALAGPPAPTTRRATVRAARGAEDAVSGLLRRGAEQLRQGAYDQAMQAFNAALRYDPDNQGALVGRIHTVTLKQLAAGRRELHESETRFRRVTGGLARASSPGELLIALRPANAQPGDPFRLRVFLHNRSNRTVGIEAVEMTASHEGVEPARAEKLPPRVGQVAPHDTAVVYEVGGEWTPEQRHGRLTAIVTLTGEDALIKTIWW